MTRHERRNLAKGLAFVAPWLVGFAAFTAAPIWLSLYYSFADYSMLQPPLSVGAANYRGLWHDPVFLQSLGNTFRYAAMALPAGMLVSLGLALLLNTKVHGLTVYRTLIFLPCLVPAVAAAVLWKWMFDPQHGILNHLLSHVGVPPIGWINDPKLALPSLALMSLWGVGNTVVIYLAGLQDVPRELLEAAEIDGASALGRLWHVTLPMLSPVIFFNLVMAIIGTLQVFTMPYIMTEGGPNNATEFFTMQIFDNAFRFSHMGYASAMAWVQLLIVLACTALAFWTSKKWVHYQGA